MAKKIKWSKIYNKDKAYKIVRKQQRQTKYDMVWKNLETNNNNPTANK